MHGFLIGGPTFLRINPFLKGLHTFAKKRGYTLEYRFDIVLKILNSNRVWHTFGLAHTVIYSSELIDSGFRVPLKRVIDLFRRVNELGRSENTSPGLIISITWFYVLN